MCSSPSGLKRWELAFSPISGDSVGGFFSVWLVFLLREWAWGLVFTEVLYWALLLYLSFCSDIRGPARIFR